MCDGYEKVPDILPPTRRIICLGDIHGDLLATKKSLQLAQVIDKNGNWIGGDTVVVQVGDQVDRCRPNLNEDCGDKEITKNDESDIRVLEYFEELHKKAKQKGGAVYSLIGNHEIMNVQGDIRYVSYEGRKEFGGDEGRRKAFEAGQGWAKRMACTRPAVLVIGSTVFAHAGILPKLAKKYTPKQVNQAVKNYLLNDYSQEDKEIVENRKISPFWTRINSSESDMSCGMARQSLRTWNVGRMIVGHTPQIDKEGANAICKGRVWRIDVGSSKAFDPFVQHENRIQVLEILNDGQKVRVLR